MQKPPIPIDETQRLRALQNLKILDSSAEERFDRLTRLACRMFNVPIALVSLIDRDRQWFKSRQGLDVCETGRDISFCGHAIMHEGPLTVPDTLTDSRYRDNPLVTGPPNIRFYAGHPVHSPDGSRVGTLCVIDRIPRELAPDDIAVLGDLAAMVDRELSLLSLATIDELTHLCNRRGFLDLAAYVLALCHRTPQPATLMAIDLDGFKAINDLYGHAEGDNVLRQFGTMLLKHFRTSDVVARLGGDEFCVLASGATEESVTASLARFSETFAQSELTERHPELSWSVGLSEFRSMLDTPLQAMLRTADERMYAAKVQGRSNRPEISTDALRRG